MKNLERFKNYLSIGRIKWVLVGIGLLYIFIVGSLASAWYADQMIQPFHFFNDLPEWKQLDKEENKYLKELRKIATIQSIGSSTRIEGSTLTDAEIATLIKNLKTY